MQGKRVMSNPKYVETTKFIKRGRKDFDLTGFSLLELIGVFPLAPDGFLVSTYAQRHLKKDSFHTCSLGIHKVSSRKTFF